MTDIHDRFRSLDRATAPDLWSEVVQRASVASRPSSAWPWTVSRIVPVAVAAAALVLATAGAAMLLGPPDVGPPVPTTDPSGTPRTAVNLGGAWTAAEPMAEVRDSHTATLLNDGRVLVAGGSLGPAELYDPATGGWTTTGSMVTPRGGHTATLLSDGRVLVAGGFAAGLDNNSSLLGSAELYDPTTGSWTATPPMVEMRGRGHTATLLPDGRVLVAGGYIGAGVNGIIPTDTVELYDPVTDAWTATSRLSQIRYYHVAVALQDGRVLVAGSLHSSARAEVYDPRTATWALTGRMLRGRHDFQAVHLRDGQVLVAGGEGVPDDVELYDPVTEAWGATGSLPGRGTGFFTLTLLSDGTVLASGMVGQAERYDPDAGTWTVTGGGDDPTSEDHITTLLPDGRVLSVGGFGDSASAYLYVPEN